MEEKKPLTETLRQWAETLGDRSEGELERFEQILHSADLDAIVCQALSSSGLTVRDVSIRQVQGGIGVGTAVHVVEGTADERGQVRPWAVILKTLNKLPGQENEREPHYWKREAEFFGSSLASEIDVGLRPPRCFAIQSISDDEIALWLEHIPHRSALWTDDQFYIAALKVGQFNGHWYGAKNRLAEQWMNDQCGFMEPWFPLVDESLDTIETRWESFREMGVSLDDAFLPQLRRAWIRCKANVQMYKSAPQTLCHFDAHQKNLLWNEARPDDLVAIDWAYVGPGALGQEIVVMISQRTRSGHDLAPARLRDFSEQVYGHYMEGLRQVGWAGSNDKVRVGYLAYATILEAAMTVHRLYQALNRARGEQTTMYTLEDRVTYQWEYFGQCMSELEALTG